MTTPQRTIEEEFDFVCKSAGLVKLGISKKPTYLTVDKSEGVELDGTTVRVFNNYVGARNYKNVPGSKLQAIVDAFNAPAPKPVPKIDCKHPTFQWQTPNRKVCMDCGEDITPIEAKGQEYEFGVKKAQPKPAEVVKPKGDEKMETRKEEKALAIKEPEVTLSIDVIKQYICPTATDAEAFNFLQLCHYRQLNPFLKEAYLIKYGNTTSMVVGKDAFTRKAEESPAFEGYEAGIVLFSEGKFEDRVGTILKPKEELVGGWAKVYRKNTAKPFEVRVSLAEYDKKMNNWKSMPATMIRKVALVQALREAFTKELGGCYDATEIDPDAMVVEEKKQ